ncbi:VOC family protein [Actinobacillus succinogenes]|nr:VOC family protein [Actinobacillus succinogenes]
MNVSSHKIFQNSTALYREYVDFERKIRALAAEMRINLADYVIDHLALRVNSLEAGKNWLERLLKCGTILSDNLVNGRIIYLIRLEEPLPFLNQFIDVIELPFPKDKIYRYETWEHIEFVIPLLAKESTNEWINRIQSVFLWNQFDRLTIKVSEPKAEGELLPNPSIAVSLKDNSRNHVSIKVHPYSIKKIVEVFE